MTQKYTHGSDGLSGKPVASEEIVVTPGPAGAWLAIRQNTTTVSLDLGAEDCLYLAGLLTAAAAGVQVTAVAQEPERVSIHTRQVEGE
jgi:hypothetical protein